MALIISCTHYLLHLAVSRSSIVYAAGTPKYFLLSSPKTYLTGWLSQHSEQLPLSALLNRLELWRTVPGTHNDAG